MWRRDCVQARGYSGRRALGAELPNRVTVTFRITTSLTHDKQPFRGLRDGETKRNKYCRQLFNGVLTGNANLNTKESAAAR